MLAANDFFVLLVLLSVGAMAWKRLDAQRLERRQERMQRWRVLEEALRNPSLDAATRQQLLLAVEGRPSLWRVWRDWLVANLVPRRVFGVAAWFGVLIGGLLFATQPHPSDREAGIALAITGFAILCVPYVVRELDLRAARR